MGKNAYFCNRKNFERITMKHCKYLVLSLCLAAWLPTMGQPTLTFRGGKVYSVKIAESNNYFDRKDHEMVYPPEAWVEYSMFWDNSQILLERKAQRTKTTPIDSSAWLHLDSLLTEIGICRPTTAAELGITEKMLKKWTKARWLERNDRGYLRYTIPDQVTVANLDLWLAEQYEQYKDTNTVTITTDAFGFFTVEIWLGGKKTKDFSVLKDELAEPYFFNGRNCYNLNTYRHLCALMPKTFDFTYEDFLKQIVYEFFQYLIEKDLLNTINKEP